MRPAWLWTVGALLVATSGAAQAQAETTAAQVEQRIRLTASLIGDSATAQRIVGSGRRDAIGHLDEGRVHQAVAEDLLQKGDVAGARRAVDEALRHIGLARRLVPDSPARAAAARQRYEQMQAALDRLLQAWHARVGPSADEDGDHLYASELMQTAQQFARESRHEEAVFTLGQSERHVLSGMNRVLHATTLDYTARAESPAQELALELARHRSLMDLVPLALRDLKPPPDAVQLIERYRDSSHALRAQAEQTAQHGDTALALSQIRNATLFLQRALGAAGVVTPQPVGTGL